MKQTNKKHVVVIGGGFAGLNFIQNLYHNPGYAITLIDKNNYNYFTPLLYQVATGFLEPSSISYPFRKLFQHKNITFHMAALERIIPETNTVRLSDNSEITYDILVLAAGSKTNFFGNKAIEANSFSLKGIDDALFMRNELIKTFELASLEPNPAKRKALLTVVIAGGGPTGVELAGMLAEFKRYTLGADYPTLKRAIATIYLIEGSPNLLAPMSEKSHRDAFQALRADHVHIKLATRVVNFENNIVQLSDGSNINAHTLIWAAGVKANSFLGINQNSMDKGNRLITNSFNQVHGHSNIYAIGDISIQFKDKDYPNGHPQLAQPAIQQGKHLAKNLMRLHNEQPLKPFVYFDRGDMAIIGRKTALADLFKHKLHFGGLLGLLSWLFIHLISLVNYNNKIKTLYNWLVAYLTCDQVLRMIFHSETSRDQVNSDKSITTHT
ncbi:NAD(P)/FAD-dependent oxidoreductase [Larkinella insperata]|uniref:NADH:ubiquinone reductase (non-electrogenic) n=1 Tax=Larkinella insperata TaxID=332158 RepID=A0ABW3Q828_9BACT